jgi:RNA polymerase sigma-70 factor, ECF subfamily
MSTADVLEAMRGDHDAFALLITVATARLYALACLILHDSDRAEDATQEAFVRAWREIPRLRDVERFDAWLRRLVVNACYDESRRVARRAEVSLRSVGSRSVVDPSASTAESDRVERAFRHLPLDQRTVLVLQHYGSLSHTEIAATLGIPVGTVKSRVRYGVAAMRAALEADDRSTAMPAGLRSGDAGDILVAAGSVWVVDGCSNAVLRLPVGAFGP